MSAAVQPSVAKGKERKQYTCDELYDMLSTRYGGTAYAVFPEVRNSTGVGAMRSADAIIMALWPSLNFRITGIEIKASRYDWLKELRNPKKAEDMIRFCDEWLILANHDVVDLEKDAFPETWGLLVPHAGGLKLVKSPTLNDDRGQMPRPFTAALLRRASEFALSKKQTAGIRREERERVDREHQAKLESKQREFDQLKLSVDEFEKASGIRLNGYTGGRTLGEIVKAHLSRDRWDDPETRLRHILDTATGIVSTVSAQLAALQSTPEVQA